MQNFIVARATKYLKAILKMEKDKDMEFNITQMGAFYTKDIFLIIYIMDGDSSKIIEGSLGVEKEMAGEYINLKIRKTIAE